MTTNIIWKQQVLLGNNHSNKFINTVLDHEEVVNYPVDILNHLKSSGLSPHKLELKEVFQNNNEV